MAKCACPRTSKASRLRAAHKAAHAKRLAAKKTSKHKTKKTRPPTRTAAKHKKKALRHTVHGRTKARAAKRSKHAKHSRHCSCKPKSKTPAKKKQQAPKSGSGHPGVPPPRTHP